MKRTTHVFCNYAMSVDGKIASYERKGASFTSSADRSRMAKLRAMSDVIVVGAETVRQDNPQFRINSTELVENRIRNGRTPHPAVCIISRTGKILENSRLFDIDDRPVYVATDDESAPLPKKASKIKLEKPLRARALVQMLRAKGYFNILVEGGGLVNSLFLREKAVDDIYLTISPLMIGGSKSPTPFDGKGLGISDFLKLTLLEAKYHFGELFLHYKVLKEEQS